MLRKTHISIGIATALAVIHPATVTSCLVTLIGGGLGGWLPDIDLSNRKKINESDDDDYTDYTKNGIYYDPYDYGEVGNDHPGWFHDNETTQNAIQIIIILGIMLFLDKYLGDGICNSFIDNFGRQTIIGLIALVGLIILGIHTCHRTFTHSLLGCTLFSLFVWMAFPPLGLAFICGFLSHIIIDVLNKKPGNQYFWPCKKRIYLNLVLSNGKCNNILGNIGVIASIFMFFNCLIPSLISNPKLEEVLQILRSPSLRLGPIMLSGLAVYLIAVNVITFIAFAIEHLIYYFSATWNYSDNDSAFVVTTLFILAFAGGGIGMLLVVLLTTKGRISKAEESNNTSLYLVSIVAIVIWAVLTYIITNPFKIDFITHVTSIIIGNTSRAQTILIYFISINVITFLLILLGQEKSRDFSVVEILTMILALLGGAVGGYLAMGISNNKMAVNHFTFGLPLMMTMHAIIFSLILHFCESNMTIF